MHSKHTKGSDKGRVNNKATVLTGKRTQKIKNQVEKTHRGEKTINTGQNQ